MYDISKLIANPRLSVLDPHGNMMGLDHWSPLLAHRMAERDGLSLTEEHWQVLFCLRERYRAADGDWNANRLSRELAADFADMGGLRALYQLFPKGPLAQACCLAGLPLPDGTIDTSFGCVH